MLSLDFLAILDWRGWTGQAVWASSNRPHFLSLTSPLSEPDESPQPVRAKIPSLPSTVVLSVWVDPYAMHLYACQGPMAHSGGVRRESPTLIGLIDAVAGQFNSHP